MIATEYAALLAVESAIRHALLAPTFGNAHTAEIKAALTKLDETRNTQQRPSHHQPGERDDLRPEGA